MTRNILDDAHTHPAIRQTIASNHEDLVREVQAAVATNDVVVVGMKQNPAPKQARKALTPPASCANTWVWSYSAPGGVAMPSRWTDGQPSRCVFVKGVSSALPTWPS
jgi:hypothetical protein